MLVATVIDVAAVDDVDVDVDVVGCCAFGGSSSWFMGLKDS